MSAAGNQNEEIKGNGSDLSFEDSQEDEFEVEDVIQKEGEEEGGDEWEDVDSADEEKQGRIAAAIERHKEANMAMEDEEEDEEGEGADTVAPLTEAPKIWDD